MSMPEFPKPNPDLTQEQALTMILSSIALEELALSHIINAEGEKIQYVLSQTNRGGCPADLRDILAVNQSVSGLLEIVLQNQMLLKNKMERVLEHLPRPPAPPCPPVPPWPPYPPVPPCPPEPPCPPVPPRPPIPPCPPEPPCGPADCGEAEPPICFGLVPGFYTCATKLRWQEISARGRFFLMPGDCSKIQLPRTGTFLVEFYLELGKLPSSGEAELLIFCEDKEPLVKKMCFDSCKILRKRTVVQLPCSCSPCYASILVCTGSGLQLQQGTVMFTRL